MRTSLSFPKGAANRWISQPSRYVARPGTGSQQPWGMTFFSALKMGLLALVSIVWVLLGWAATLALAAVALMAVPVSLMLGVFAIAFAVKLVVAILGGGA